MKHGCTHNPVTHYGENCPGWYVNIETGHVEACFDCKRFQDDDEALDHVAHCLRLQEGTPDDSQRIKEAP